MRRDEFVYMIKEVRDELEKEFPDLGIRVETYRDGGSIAFFMPDEELIMLAPIQQLVEKNHITHWFNHIEILKEGCKTFSDSYKKENVAGRLMFDGLPLQVIESKEKREKYKYDIKILLKSLRLNKYINKN